MSDDKDDKTHDSDESESDESEENIYALTKNSDGQKTMPVRTAMSYAQQGNISVEIKTPQYPVKTALSYAAGLEHHGDKAPKSAEAYVPKEIRDQYMDLTEDLPRNASIYSWDSIDFEKEEEERKQLDILHAKIEETKQAQPQTSYSPPEVKPITKHVQHAEDVIDKPSLTEMAPLQRQMHTKSSYRFSDIELFDSEDLPKNASISSLDSSVYDSSIASGHSLADDRKSEQESADDRKNEQESAYDRKSKQKSADDRKIEHESADKRERKSKSETESKSSDQTQPTTSYASIYQADVHNMFEETGLDTTQHGIYNDDSEPINKPFRHLVKGSMPPINYPEERSDTSLLLMDESLPNIGLARHLSYHTAFMINVDDLIGEEGGDIENLNPNRYLEDTSPSVYPADEEERTFKPLKIGSFESINSPLSRSDLDVHAYGDEKRSVQSLSYIYLPVDLTSILGKPRDGGRKGCPFKCPPKKKCQCPKKKIKMKDFKLLNTTLN